MDSLFVGWCLLGALALSSTGLVVAAHLETMRPEPQPVKTEPPPIDDDGMGVASRE